jgi:hypothetical protein
MITAMTVLAAKSGEIEGFDTPGLEQSGTENRGKGIQGRASGPALGIPVKLDERW